MSWKDDDDSDSDSVDDDETPQTVICVHCGAEFDDESIRCPVCNEYPTGASPIWSGKPVWYILLALAGIIAVLAALSPM